MKRAIRGFVLIAFIAALPSVVAAQHSGWRIEDYEVRIGIEKNGTLDVTETITADFDTRKRGIYRDIPIHYDVRFHQYTLRLRLIGVTDGRGKAREVKKSNRRNYVRLRIGNPNVYLTGRQVYKIHYEVDKAVIWHGDFAMVMWNAIGHEWGVPIKSAAVTVVLPAAPGDDGVAIDAWTGRWGAMDKDFVIYEVDSNSRRIEAGDLGEGRGLSIEVSVPYTMIAKPSAIALLAGWATDNLAYGLVPLTLLGFLFFWYRLGRDMPGRGSIVVNYQPPDELSPTEVGTLIDEKIHMRDISATIVDLAVRGYLQIDELKKPGLLSKGSYLLKKRKEPKGLRRHEKTIYHNIFKSGISEREVDDLEQEFYTAIPEIKQEVIDALKEKGYFKRAPSTVRGMWTGFGLLALGILVVGVAMLQMTQIGRVFLAPLIVSGVISAIIVIIVSQYMPRKTRAGRMAWEQVAGLEEYIRRTNDSPLDGKKGVEVFEKLLPFAIVMGLATRWAKRFEGIYQKPPEWFHASWGRNFSTLYLTDSITRSVDAMNTSLPTSPRSSGGSGGGFSSGGFSGGGFSGGGFGGGGGGSW